MLQTMFGTNNESEMSAPGFHSTKDIPANFIWLGIDNFLNELNVSPRSILQQVHHSLKLYCQVKAENNYKIVIPTFHNKFMEFFNENDNPTYLGLVYKNGSERV